MAKARSPRYPSIGLQEAIDKAKKVYDAEHTHVAPRDAIVKDMGYTSLNGASAQVIASLSRYGLLQSEKEGLRISSEAVKILMLQEGDRERVEAIEKLAFTPELFAELKERYPDALPSEETLRHELTTKKGFLRKAADDVIRVYRDTIELVSAEKATYSAKNASEEKPQREVSLETALPTKREPAVGYTIIPDSPVRQRSMDIEESNEALIFKLSKDSEVRIVFSGQVTQEAIEKLKAHLDLSKDAFPTQAELKKQMERS